MSGLAGLAIVGKVTGFAKAVPAKAWYALAIIAALVAAFLWHQHTAHKALKAADSAGYARAMNDVETRAKALKAKADALSAKISAAERNRNDEANRRISAAADSLRLSGPGKAVCPRSASVPSGSGRSVAASGQGTATVAQVPDGSGVELIGLPFPGAVAGAEQSDLNRAEVLSWRSWYSQQKAAWPK